MKKTLMQLSLVGIIALSCWQSSSAQEDLATPPNPIAQPKAAAPITSAPKAASGMQAPSYTVSDTPLPMNGRPDVFYNYYLQPSMDGTAASMYPAPYPVPANVGRSYYTYQPLLPHEYMYRHNRVYYTPHGTRDNFYVDPCTGNARGSSYTKTTVRYTYGSNHLSPMLFSLPSFGRSLKSACGATCR